jgi:S1-C subfamily serine protease
MTAPPFRPRDGARFGKRRTSAVPRSARILRKLVACAIAALVAGAQPAWADYPSAVKALAAGNHAAAVARLRPLAEAADVRAQFLLGQILRNPANPERDVDEAYRWFSAAADANHADAAFWLGMMHRLGESVPKNAEQAIEFWQRAAAAGSVAAQAALAQSLLAGDGTEKDAAAAVRLARPAAQKGNALAQAVLAQAYLRGEGGLPRSLPQFVHWSQMAANQGNRLSMEVLAVSFHTGTGVPQDYVRAHMWANLAASRGSARAAKLRDELAAKMTPDQIAEAQKAARQWHPSRMVAAPDGSTLSKRIATGSGFVIAAPGYVLTNNHVVDNCAEVRAPAYKAAMKVVARDAKHDLALLEGDLPGTRAAHFRASSAPRLGEPVIVAGFPLSDLLATSLNVTTGTISALAGPRNNEALFQITAPVQRGNSGGPVLDVNGDVLGVVVSKLNALRVAMATGDVPQNVNFAIDGKIARAFVEAQGIELPAADETAPPPQDTPEKARGFTLLLECWR